MVRQGEGVGGTLLDAVPLGPGVVAGFSSRRGGRSGGPWSGLNLGASVGDDPAAVAANRALLEREVGVPLLLATQVHGAGVAVVGPDDVGTTPRVDALVTTSPDLAVGVYVADCAPVLLADPVARVVAAVHAGRAGLVAGVVQAAVTTMVGLGAAVERLHAVVGPCIAPASYEVPADMRDDVAAVVPAAAGRTSTGTPAVDLAGGVRAVLEGCGVASVRVDGRDTYRDAAFYSHRRAVHAGDAATGRSVGVVRLTG